MTRKVFRDARRARIIEVAILSIARRGFAKTTRSQVARDANLPLGLVRSYFPKPRDLFVESLRHMILAYESSWRERVCRQPTPYARLHAMVEADFDCLMSDRDEGIVWCAFWCEAQWRPEIMHICERLSQVYYEQVWAAMQQIIDEGGYGDLDAAELAHAFNAMLNGLWMEILVNPRGCEIELAKRACRSFLARAFPKESRAAMALSTAA